MLEAEEVKRDEMGWWSHSAIVAAYDSLEDGDILNFSDIPGAEGMEFKIVSAPAEFQESEDGSIADWEPTAPEGEWILLSIWESEDGAFAAYGRPLA